MTVCNRCGKENQDHYKFCLGCGAELTAAPKPGGDMAMMKTMLADPNASPLAGMPMAGGGSGPLRGPSPGVPQPMQIVEVQFPPGGRVAFETGARDRLVHQQVWVLEGAIDGTQYFTGCSMPSRCRRPRGVLRREGKACGLVWI